MGANRCASGILSRIFSTPHRGGWSPPTRQSGAPLWPPGLPRRRRGSALSPLYNRRALGAAARATSSCSLTPRSQPPHASAQSGARGPDASTTPSSCGSFCRARSRRSCGCGGCAGGQHRSSPCGSAAAPSQSCGTKQGVQATAARQSFKWMPGACSRAPR